MIFYDFMSSWTPVSALINFEKQSSMLFIPSAYRTVLTALLITSHARCLPAFAFGFVVQFIFGVFALLLAGLK